MKERLIEWLLQYGIIKINFTEPLTFKSGIVSPIYCNFRECSSHPEIMSLISRLFVEVLPKSTEGIVGVATGAVSHASLLANAMNLPSGYVRPDAKVKDYGLRNLIEGIDVSGKRIAVIEDLVSTAGSVINNAEIVMKAGASSVKLFSIFSYNMEKSKRELQKSGFELQSILSIVDILPYLKTSLSKENYQSLVDWVADPEKWFENYKHTFDFGFLTTLRRSAKENNSIISFGLDPIIKALPTEFAGRGIAGAKDFYLVLVDEMKRRGVMPGMFKPNEGFYVKNQFGCEAIYDLMASLPDKHSDYFCPITLDSKRGDIGKSSLNYAEQQFVSYPNVSAVTVSPYMGYDSVGSFIGFCSYHDSKGVYILNKTSNKGSQDFQMAKMADGRLLYQHVSDKILQWSKGRPGVGAVVAGNSPEELRNILAFFAGKSIPVLVPGVGDQGGSAKVVADIAREVGFELALLRINSSSGLSHPWYGSGGPIPPTNECIEMCINELVKMNEEVGVIL